MKTSMALLLCLLSSSVFAFVNEVECTGTYGTKEIDLLVEQPFPSSSVFKRAVMTVSDNGVESEFNYTLTSRFSSGFNTVTYTGGSLRLEVNIWPDNRPQWGKRYRSTLNSSDVTNATISNLYCNFPNAN